VPAAQTGASTRILSPVRGTASGIVTVRTDEGMNPPYRLRVPRQQAIVILTQSRDLIDAKRRFVIRMIARD